MSFGTTVDLADQGGLIAGVASGFRPRRFTMAYLGASCAAGLRVNPNVLVH